MVTYRQASEQLNCNICNTNIILENIKSIAISIAKFQNIAKYFRIAISYCRDKQILQYFAICIVPMPAYSRVSLILKF